jgi:hypothetical protein
VVLQIVPSLIDNSRVVIYNSNIFIIQAIDVSGQNLAIVVKSQNTLKRQLNEASVGIGGICLGINYSVLNATKRNE